MLIESGTIIGKIVAVDSTHLKAYSGRAMDNRTGRSDPDARVGRGRRGFILGYRVHTDCCADSHRSEVWLRVFIVLLASGL
jgi:hypothetical protein